MRTFCQNVVLEIHVVLKYVDKCFIDNPSISFLLI